MIVLNFATIIGNQFNILIESMTKYEGRYTRNGTVSSDDIMFKVDTIDKDRIKINTTYLL